MFSISRAFSTAVSGPFKLAIVGSGPAGFYTAHRLLKEWPNTQIDMFDILPVPHGLVRFGVAPDHPEVKNVMTTFDKVAEDDRFRFFGNVPIGTQFAKGIGIKELQENFDAVLLSYGASEDRKLGIPGEDAYGVESARSFVSWYNGHPNYCDLQIPPLDDTDTAVVIGQGNVALDIARILLSPIDVLRKTDITEYALEALSKSKIKHVHVVGRRGPVQVSFTSKELREQMALPGVEFHADMDLIKKEITDSQAFISKNRPLKRLLSLLEKGSPTKQGDKSWTAKFLRSPIEVLTNGQKACGIKYELNRLEGPLEQRKAIGTGEYETQECGVILTSIGYKSIPIDDSIPFDKRQGRIPNRYGKMMKDGEEVSGMYTAGWLKRGPTGVIVSTMTDAYETADTIVDDLKNGKEMLDRGESKAGAEGLKKLMEKRNIRPVNYQDWKKIEAAEFAIGEKMGKPREKFCKIKDMLDVL
ncbi:NADPH:adrenodoxin oxidoreductase [Cokeromyces recurvatus]|uniref:NADPH:adrenodoxin oxidoreductase n=1 Tax=Cokeromyces recurvatus TaxID=90255 RepID=UPI00221E50A7|nr:NADPH:adrenodoxin oxidoreductase [Cokeromyces recurvatus]KAI7903913.1 NADPH:adrenodoxin oxidoreductase [Cokeromyces recurvatus]